MNGEVVFYGLASIAASAAAGGVAAHQGTGIVLALLVTFALILGRLSANAWKP